MVIRLTYCLITLKAISNDRNLWLMPATMEIQLQVYKTIKKKKE